MFFIGLILLMAGTHFQRSSILYALFLLEGLLGGLFCNRFEKDGYAGGGRICLHSIRDGLSK